MSSQMESYIKAIRYKITSGEEFLWNCYGPNARYLESSNDEYHISAIFDTETAQIYEASISSTYSGDIRYRWIDLNYIDACKSEAKSRGVDWMEFSDGQTWHMTDDFDDIIDKISKIPYGEEYDRRVVLSLDLEEDVKEMIETAAALRGISIDEFIEQALRAVIEEEKE